MLEAYLLLYLRSAAVFLFTQHKIAYELASSVDTSVRKRVAELEREAIEQMLLNYAYTND